MTAWAAWTCDTTPLAVIQWPSHATMTSPTRSPACSPGAGSSYNHLDNFTTDGRCTGIVDFGNFKTIKLF